MKTITLTKYQQQLLQPYINERRNAEIALQNQLVMITGVPFEKYDIKNGVLEYIELNEDETNTKQQ